MSNKDSTIFAYRCPSCGCTVKSMGGIFSLSGSFFRLKCSCGESVSCIEKPENENITVTVPCMICGYSHVYNMSRDSFFNNNVFVASCPVSNISLCFIGNESKVDEAVENSNKELINLLGDSNIESVQASDESYPILSDPTILDMVKFVVDDLNEEGKIYCGCKDHNGEYSCDIFDDCILVKCSKCQREKKVDIVGTSHALDFLEIDELTLE